MSRSFFEYLGMADMEKIHSQVIAWIFSKDCLAVNKNDKINLLSKISGCEEIGNIESVFTEVKNIDIVIKAEHYTFVIENKIKSTEHSNQLERYQKALNKDMYPNQKYLYLTLIDDRIRNSNWIKISYVSIYNHLKKYINKKHNGSDEGHSHHLILTEYLNYLEKITRITQDFESNFKNYETVFVNGGQTKEKKSRNQYKSENEKFISDNQLETLFQKLFLHSISAEFDHDLSVVAESRGTALIEFYIERNINFEKREYSNRIQLQNDCIKFVFSVDGPKYHTSKKKWIESVIDIMKQVGKENILGYNKLNQPKSKAYVSLSKKLPKNYWEMERNEFLNFINSELENGKKLSSSLKEKLQPTSSIS